MCTVSVVVIKLLIATCSVNLLNQHNRQPRTSSQQVIKPVPDLTCPSPASSRRVWYPSLCPCSLIGTVIGDWRRGMYRGGR